MKTEASEQSTMQQAVSSSVPAFLAKLWAMVNEESTDSVIGWTESHKSFYIRNQSVFSMELLPVYYKHNNMSSFIRQLNMYGFRKVLSPMAGSLKNESDEMIFAHPDFVKDEPWGLENIKRKISHHKDLPHASNELMARLFSEVKTMKNKQDSLDSHLSKMKRENESLWREVLVLRQKHSKQQQIVNQLIQFLVSFVQSGRGATSAMGLKRKQLPMLEDGGGQHNGPSAKAARLNRTFSMDENVAASIDNRSMSSSAGSPGPVIHDVTDQVTSPPDEVVVGSSSCPPSSQLPINFMISPGRSPSTVDWTPLVETLASPAGPSADLATTTTTTTTGQQTATVAGTQEEEQQQQQQNDTTVALTAAAAGDASQEPTPVLCDSLLESIQADLDGLRGLMASPTWRMDTSSVQNILQDPDQSLAAAASGGAESDQQLVSYNPSLLDLFTTEPDELFPDLRGLEENEEPAQEAADSTDSTAAAASILSQPGRGSGLNTPTVELCAPTFPAAPATVTAARKASSSGSGATGGRRSGLNTPTIEVARTPFPPPSSKAAKRDGKRRK